MPPLVFALVVAVEVGSVDAPPELEARLLSACSAGLRQGRCVSARSSAGPADVVAMVSWTDERRALIEVGSRSVAGSEWVSRELTFEPDDPRGERWRSVGFTIALLLRDQLSDSASASTATRRQARMGLQASAFTGTGVVHGSWRLGLGARGWASFRVGPSWGWLIGGAARLSSSWDSSPSMRWLDLSLGAGLFRRELWGQVEARARVELLVENVAAELQQGGVSQRADAWVAGLMVGAELLLPFSADWAGVVRADSFWLDGATVVRAAGRREAASAGAGVLAGVGAEYRF